MTVSIHDELADRASAIADDAHNAQLDAEREKADLEQKLLATKARVDSLRSLPERHAAFLQTLEGNEMFCPVCWLEHDKKSRVHAIGGGTDAEDFFRCSSCKEEFSVRF